MRYINIWCQGSRLILPAGRTFETIFLSWSHEHIIWFNTRMNEIKLYSSFKRVSDYR